MTFCVVPEVNASLILQINTFSLVFNFRFTILAPLSTLPFAPQKASIAVETKDVAKMHHATVLDVSMLNRKL